MTLVLVALGAAVGAPLRYVMALWLDRSVPAGTLLVNAVGSFALGVLVATDPAGDELALLGAGFCGGLTTYSAFAVQACDLGRFRGLVYALTTVALGLGACGLGFWVTRQA